MWGDEDPNGKPNSYGGDLERHRKIILRRYALNSHLGYLTISNEDAEDTCLTSNDRGTELEGAWGNKGNLVLNQEEKGKEVQDGHPLRIIYTAAT